jgi:hypothetical protein
MRGSKIAVAKMVRQPQDNKWRALECSKMQRKVFPGIDSTALEIMICKWRRFRTTNRS